MDICTTMEQIKLWITEGDHSPTAQNKGLRVI